MLYQYDLQGYKDILFTSYIYYNNALIYSKNGLFLDALIDISKFLAYYPFDEDGNKLFIYLLVKNGSLNKAKEEIVKFEEMFPLNPWIMEVEKEGIEQINLPNIEVKDINIDTTVSSFETLQKEYVNYRLKNINDIIDLITHFFDIVRIAKENQKNSKKNYYKEIINFYEKNFLSFLSKKEIRIESFDGKNYNELSENDNKLIDVVGIINDEKKPDGTIKTIYPSIYLRSKMIYKQKVQIYKK